MRIYLKNIPAEFFTPIRFETTETLAFLKTPGRSPQQEEQQEQADELSSDMESVPDPKIAK